MKDELIHSRVYVDTFAGGQYRHDMEENLGAMSPVKKVDRATLKSMPRHSIFRTDEQKDLIAFFTRS